MYVFKCIFAGNDFGFNYNLLFKNTLEKLIFDVSSQKKLLNCYMNHVNVLVTCQKRFPVV